MKPVADSRQLVKGAMILTMAALITKILSAVYRVPFQNIVGDVGFYIYQQVYPFYGIVLVLSTYGFPVVISKLYTEQVDGRNQGKADRLLAISLFSLGLLGVILFALFYFGSDWMAGMMGDRELGLLFRIVSLLFLFFPFISVFRGYFQGKGNMVPTAVSQVAEQAVRVTTILFLSALFVQKGYSLYFAGGGAVFGSVTGGIVSMMVLGFFFWKKRRSNPFGSLKRKELFADSASVIKALIVQGFAISVSGMLLILFQLADSLNLYTLLLETGLGANEAKTAKGIFDRGQPLVQLGTVVATSMSLSLVPAISAEKARNRMDHILQKVLLALQTSLLFGAAAAAGLYSIIAPVNIMLFENDSGSDVIGLLSLTILFGSLILTVTSILQGLDKPMFPAMAILSGFGLKYILNLYFIPPSGTMGAVYATLLSMFAVLAILLLKLRLVLGQRILSIGFSVKILFASAVMAVLLRLYTKWTHFLYHAIEPDRLAATIQAFSGVLLGALCYFMILIKTKALQEEELSALPFGSRLAQLFSKKTGGSRK
ncbi:oligosaccharide flippase family protein [Bacillus sp. REN3]|uniref:putative polysaccharide biosynthesis protein n=1 Tax=Bacillus sp. REN3 TaxID=2802440 RepID=UPI001AEEE6BB|nr:oligosaccharide flippase family protein [Bacillus sp. REN3]